MMKKKHHLGMTAALVCLVIGACKTTPPAGPEKTSVPPDPEPAAAAPEAPQEEEAPKKNPDQGPPDQKTLDSLAAGENRVEEARTRAMVFDGPKYDPEHWTAAEAQYTDHGNQVKKGTLGEAKAGIVFYTQLAEAYDGVFNTAIPLYAKDREIEILQARDKAIEAGILDLSPARLEKADDQVREAIASYEAKDYFPAAKSALQSVDRYRGLKVGCQAYVLRMDIEANNLAQYDRENYRLGDEVLREAVASYDGLEIDEALINGEEAYLRYNLVWNTGWKAYASERGGAADAERTNALRLKANVAVRDSFDAASNVYDRAQLSFNAERFVDAADLYFQSEFLFAAVSSTAQEKRQIAEDAIKMAEEKAAASDETARRAEELLHGGTQ